ncbi:MAG: glycosyltransferase family 2 protein [Reichenbachiella sp.]
MILIEIILLGYFIYVVSYVLFFSFGGHFYQPVKLEQNLIEYKKFAILIPGYKEDNVIINTIEGNLKVNYPTEYFDIIIIADSFKKETLKKISNYPIITQVVSFEKSTKVKALSYTIEKLEDNYDNVIILDADNIMEEDYLIKVNSYLTSNPYKAIQTQRWPKNKNNDLAILDGISESINNHVYRQGAHATGFSVSLSGSGMVFDRHLFQDLITKMTSIGGFDRELELKFLENKIKVKYFKEAKVFDQKTDDPENFNKQRTRWISSQYIYFIKYFRKGTANLFKGNIVYFHSTVWRNIQLPRLINLGLLTLLMGAAIIFRHYLNFSYWTWIVLWSLNAFAMAIAIPRELYSKKLLLSILMLPKLFLSMFLIMFKLKGANKKFIHTEHKEV